MVKILILELVIFFIINIGNAYNIKCKKYYNVTENDYCDKIAVENGISTKKLMILNKNLNCKENLTDFNKVCVKSKISFTDYFNLNFEGRCGKNYDKPSNDDEIYFMSANNNSNNNNNNNNNEKKDDDEKIKNSILNNDEEYLQIKNNTIFIVNEYQNSLDINIKNFKIKSFNFNKCKTNCINNSESIKQIINDDDYFYKINEILNYFNETIIKDEKLFYNGCLSQCLYLNELSDLYQKENIENKILEIKQEIGNFNEYEDSKINHLEERASVDCSKSNVYNKEGSKDGGITIYRENKNNAFLRYKKWNRDARIDGCSIPTDLGKNELIPFLPACNGHDVCYNCNTNKGICDQDFFSNMKKICNSDYPWWNIVAIGECIVEAGVVFSAVDLFGFSSFDEDKKWREKYVGTSAGINNPMWYCACSSNDKSKLMSKNFLIKDSNGNYHDYY
ncbi:hypothetical protein BCR32DRAFT_268834 [Anaeromyces robustus]|uniref:LysM domain-containing protein n=1 Tax=Anaeromyces robustus TaxID=1754192 RepID=A0A1Y1X4E9_9FUNG|nr:hypothetical protein BCR32DRAFT_268834 [Anaeromyces robustus]|eukprot:ORX80518.1 hypothetical protein BCR32DRAFT_268834 [Anaeromyces robustus]